MAIFFKATEHRFTDADALQKISCLKQQHWQYPTAAQIEWINSHFLPTDIHLTLFSDSLLIGYIGITAVSFKINDSNMTAMGIGNVCIDKAQLKKGYGKMLAEKAAEIISEKGGRGLLLCHSPLVKFYESCGWRVLEYGSAILEGKNYTDKIMTLNMPDTAFAEKIEIPKNF